MTEPVSPGVSVVVPVLGRVASTRRLLESLAEAMAACPEAAEVVLVDDSAPGDAAWHRRHCARYGARYVRGPGHVGAKRNLGVRLSRHDLVLFTDSDCRVAPDLLKRYTTALRAAPSDVAGIAGPTLVEAGTTATYRIMGRSTLLNGDLEAPRDGRPMAWATTSNLCLRRAAFRSVGGFTERSLTKVAGEDVDLGLRLTGRGLAIWSDPGAVVVHDRASSDSPRAVCRRLFGYGRSETWLAARHPERRTARWNPVSLVGAVTMLALVMLRRTGGRSAVAIPVAAASALAIRARRRARPGDGPAGIADAVACAALEHAFDAGAAVAAIQLRRPDLLFSGFRSLGDGAPGDEGTNGAT